MTWSRVRRVAAAIVVGLVITLVVSAIGAQMATTSVGGGYVRDAVDEEPGDWIGGVPAIWTVDVRDHPLHRRVRYWRMQMSGVNMMIPTADFEQNKYEMRGLARHLRPAAMSDLFISALYGEAGWPLPAMSYVVDQRWEGSTPTWRAQWTIVAGEWANGNPVLVPLRPVWGGLIVNTLLAALVVLALIEGVRWALRRLRGQAGHCPACDYDLRGVAGRCPECGTPTLAGGRAAS